MESIKNTTKISDLFVIFHFPAECTTIEWSITVEDNILAIKGVSSCMTADTVIFKLDSTVADFDFRVEFPMPDSGSNSA